MLAATLPTIPEIAKAMPPISVLVLRAIKVKQMIDIKAKDERLHENMFFIVNLLRLPFYHKTDLIITRS